MKCVVDGIHGKCHYFRGNGEIPLWIDSMMLVEDICNRIGLDNPISVGDLDGWVDRISKQKRDFVRQECFVYRPMNVGKKKSCGI